jgi:hypothetical protein
MVRTTTYGSHLVRSSDSEGLSRRGISQLAKTGLLTSLRFCFALWRVDERFYEKVIKVKADVAALLNLFSAVSIEVRW